MGVHRAERGTTGSCQPLRVNFQRTVITRSGKPLITTSRRISLSPFQALSASSGPVYPPFEHTHEFVGIEVGGFGIVQAQICANSPGRAETVDLRDQYLAESADSPDMEAQPRTAARRCLRRI